MWHSSLLLCLFINFQIIFGFNLDANNRIKRQERTCTTPNGDAGECISIRNCQELLNLLPKSSRDPQVKQFLLRSQCGFGQTYPNVCCKTNAPSNPSPNNFSSSRPNHFPKQCGKTEVVSANRVVGGRPATLRAWPWMALLGFQGREQNIDWRCGGTLITNRHVVTAAHCLKRRVVLVRLGDLDVSTASDKANHVDIAVDSSKAHEKYDRIRGIMDIGIVRLRDAATFTPDVQPICLPMSQELKSENFVGFTPYIAGWGSIKFGDRDSPTHLQEAQVEVRTRDFCNSAYAKLKKPIVIDQRVICAGGGKKDSCQGDSGGPLMMPRTEDGLFYLIGVVSYGYKCAEPGYPGVYTRVSEFMDWITENTAN